MSSIQGDEGRESEAEPLRTAPVPVGRRSPVARPLPLLLALLASCAGMGYAIYSLIRSMRM